MIRLAVPEDAARINQLRAQIQALHAAGRPDIFRADFTTEMEQRVQVLISGENRCVVVCEQAGEIAGYAALEVVSRPESPYNKAHAFLHVEEFCVDEGCLRQGVGRALMAYIKEEAKRRQLPRVVLDMWAFNERALAFYEAIGFETFRYHMEYPV